MYQPGQSIFAYWQQVNAVAAELPPGEAFAVVPIAPARAGATPGAFLVQMARQKFAECLVRNTYRLATADEIAAYDERMVAESKRIKEEEVKAKGQTPIAITPEFIQIIASLSQQNQPAQPAVQQQPTAKSGK
jgi:hypothetical protein